MLLEFFLYLSVLFVLINAGQQSENNQPKFLKLSTEKNILNEQDLRFNLKLINVDSGSAQFEITDDNLTATNYVITYTLKSNYFSMDFLKRPILEQTSFIDKLQMQTNLRNLILIQQDEENKRKMLSLNKNISQNETNYSYEDDEAEDASGGKFSSDEILEFNNKTEQDLHKFVIENLDENRFYEINLTITAFEIHFKTQELNHKLRKNLRNFEFKFKTTFDILKAAKEACEDSKHAEILNGDASISLTASCYLKNSNCSKCKSNCYQIKQYSRNLSKDNPILCEACPCDSLKSTGECVEVEQSKPQQQVIKCKQCNSPYLGQFCNDCENEGIDYFKNEFGQCVRCECNDNSAFDNDDLKNKKKRKCQAITGMKIY